MCVFKIGPPTCNLAVCDYSLESVHLGDRRVHRNCSFQAPQCLTTPLPISVFRDRRIGGSRERRHICARAVTPPCPDLDEEKEGKKQGSERWLA